MSYTHTFKVVTRLLLRKGEAAEFYRERTGHRSLSPRAEAQ